VLWLQDPAALRDDDVADAFFVISTPNDEKLSVRLRQLADRHRFLLCAIDQPNHGFVAMQAIVKAGPVRIAVSTGGIAPRVGKQLRAALESALDSKFVRFIDCLNAQRQRNRVALTNSQARRAAMIAAAEGFEAKVALGFPQWFEDELAAVLPERM